MILLDNSDGIAKTELELLKGLVIISQLNPRSGSKQSLKKTIHGIIQRN
jgi:hypothetical protein